MRGSPREDDLIRVLVQPLRCWRCNRKLAELVSDPYRIVCSRCKALNTEETRRPISSPAHHDP